ncbi:hypothetical protein GGS26DRAFT_578667 [Hypomontagnella submonticulosa]|nr:hypothetical protein GGS26DRAFT_578667 [Hypomontagnella submonticulosa]
MHNATFISHTSTSQQPSISRASGSHCHSIKKTGLKRLHSSESLTSIGNKLSNKTLGVGTGTGTITNTRTGAGTRPTHAIISTTTTATTIAKTNTTITASSSSASERAPLKRKDQNAVFVTKPLPKEPGIGNMPFETSSPPTNPQPNTNRPQMPSLSAAAARAINRNPLTPKIASKTTQKPPGLIIATTPANRRQQQPTITSANRTDESSPFASHLNSNITPRSGSRQNRVDSANSTPNTTPNPERTEGWEPKSSFGLPSPRFEGEAMRRPAVSFSSIPPDGAGPGRQDGSRTSESKFFHASDVKTVRPTSSSKTAQTKGPTFVYANGNTIESRPTQPTAFTPVLGHSHDSLPSKFMYANGTPELRHSPTPPISRNSGSSSTIPKALSSRPATNPPSTSNSRPLSPAKLSSQVPQASSKTNNIPGSGRPQVLSAPQLGPSPPGLRRSSTGTSRPGGHSRQGSLAKIDQCVGAPKLVNLQLSPEASPPITVPSTPAPLTLASIIQAAEDFAEDEGTGTASPEEARSGLQSPTKSVHSVEPANELVANARRERKVQDLQITNASLEAINRTLERQLRKQTAEIRRYRRLSRSGRFSMASTALSSRVSDTFSEQGIGIMDLSDLSEMSEAEIQEEVEEDSYLDSDSASESLSPSVVAESDAKHRKRDEERLQLDLSKHQQLLIDSQKINQSIKRCLDWTEVLISEGKKALEYHVRVSDVEVGGRVLDRLELEEREDEEERPRTADRFPEDTITLDEKLLDGSPNLGGWGFEPQDRDSGIELPADGG